MQFFYIITAMVLSIGVSMFAGFNMQAETTAKINENRADTYEEQAQIYARSMRRQIQVDPTAYTVNSDGPVLLSDQAHTLAEQGGYNFKDRYQLSLSEDGTIITELTDKVLRGPSGLNETASIVSGNVLNPPAGKIIGRNDLSKLGVQTLAPDND